MEHEDFEALVDAAVAGLPRAFRDRLDNVAFRVEPHSVPGDGVLRGTPHRGILLGVYRGVPLTRRNAGYNMVTPDVIVIFQEPIEHLACNRRELERLVQRTVRHEVAHHFGISDARLRELGAY